MKNLMKFFGFAAFLAFASASCGEEDPCRNVECGTNGQCDGVVGVCQCDAGYEQDSAGLCEVVIRDKYLGTYTLTESAYDVDFDTTYVTTYTFEVTASSSSIATMLTQGWGEDANTLVPVSLTPGTSFTAPETELDIFGSLYDMRNASGTYNPSTQELTLTYDLHSTTSGDVIFECSATGFKQ